MSAEPSGKTQLIVAIIGVAGAISAAVIARGGGDKPAPAPAPVTQIQIIQNQQQLQAQAVVAAPAPPAVEQREAQLQVAAVEVKTVTPGRCVPVPRGLVAWWDADQVENGIAKDLGGHFPAKVSGVTQVPGAVGQAWEFDGRGLVEVRPAAALVPLSGLTVEFWVRPRGGQILWTRLIGVGRDNGASASSWVVGVGSHQGVYFGLFRNGAQAFIDGQQPMSDWTHVAATWDGGRERIYVNGVQQSDVAAFQGPVGPIVEPLRIGRGHTFDYGFVGALDELSLYDRALDPSEIEGIARAGSAGKCK